MWIKTRDLLNEKKTFSKHLKIKNKHTKRKDPFLWSLTSMFGLYSTVHVNCVLCRPSGIDKHYPQMGKVDRLYNRVEPYAALFWALGIVSLHHCRAGSQIGANGF